MVVLVIVLSFPHGIAIQFIVHFVQYLLLYLVLERIAVLVAGRIILVMPLFEQADIVLDFSAFEGTVAALDFEKRDIVVLPEKILQ